jgi:hypothetical protein
LTSGKLNSVSTAEPKAAMRSPLAFNACVMTGTIAAPTLALTPPAANVDALEIAVDAALACCANVARPPPAATAAMPDAPAPLLEAAVLAAAPAPAAADKSVARVAGVLSDMPAARAVVLPRTLSGLEAGAVLAMGAEAVGGEAVGAVAVGAVPAAEPVAALLVVAAPVVADGGAVAGEALEGVSTPPGFVDPVAAAP